MPSRGCKILSYLHMQKSEPRLNSRITDDDFVIVSAGPRESPHKTLPSVKKSRVFISLLTFVLLIGGLAAAVTLTGQKQEIRQRAAYTGPTLAMNPATLTKNVNETFAIGLLLHTGDETVSATRLHISYNPQFLEAQSIQAGSYLPVVLAQGAITNGQASIVLGSQPTDPKQGTGILATITFRAKSAGTSAIAYTNATQIASIGKTTNTLSGSTGANITISASTVPTAASNPADISGEGIVNLYDYALYISAWFLNNLDVADLNNDGKKSVIDYTIFMNGWYQYLQSLLE